MQVVIMVDSKAKASVVTNTDDVEFTEAISSSRMVSSLLKDHDRNLEAVRKFNRWEQERSIDPAGDPVIGILDSIHVETQQRTPTTPLHDLADIVHRRTPQNGGSNRQHGIDNGRGSNISRIQSDMSRDEASRSVTPSDIGSAFSSDIEVDSGMACRKGTVGKLFRSRGRSVQRAKEQMVKHFSSDVNEFVGAYGTPQKPVMKMRSIPPGEGTSVGAVVRRGNSPAATAHDEGKEPRLRHSSKGGKDKHAATPDDSTRTSVETLYTKIKRAVDHELSNEIHPPLIHSFTNKIFAMRTPWQLPMKERSLRNNVQQVVSFFRVLERYVEDQVFQCGPAVHPKLERVYNEIYSKVDQLFKRVSDKHIAHLAERRRLAVVGNGLYDLGDHRQRGAAPIYYQKFVIFDLSQDGTSLATEHGDVFHNQVLHFPMNSRGLPSMQYLCSVASAVLFWLDFYNRDNVVIFNYSALNYNMLLTFACAVVASMPLSTANEVDQMITNSFDWRRKCQTVITTKGNKVKQEHSHNNELPLMIPIARWPPSYKRYMSYFLSIYAAPVDFILAQQFKLRTITLINCMIPGTDVMLEVYKIGPDAAHSTAATKESSEERQRPTTVECSRYSAVFYPKCACGGKERDGVMLLSCPADYKVISMSTSSKSGKYGYVGEVTFDFTTDGAGNKRDIIVSGDVAIAMVAVTKKQRKVMATYSFNTGFVNSEILEIPKAEFDIWDTSCAIQPQGQMTISMESRQRHSSDMWNNAMPNSVVITPPASDVGVFMRYHVVKVADNEVQTLMSATNLSYETCVFALKLCPSYHDAVAILNALFVPKTTKAELENAVLRKSQPSPREIPTIASIDVPKPLHDDKNETATAVVVSKRSIDGDLQSKESGSADRSSDASGESKQPLNLEQVERLAVEPDGSMRVLLIDGTKIPVPNNTLSSLFEMFGSSKQPPKSATIAPLDDGIKVGDSPLEPGREPQVTESVPKITSKAIVPSAPPKPAPAKAPSAKEVPPATASKTPPPAKTAPPPKPPSSVVSKVAPAASVKKGPPCKMKAPPPPLPALKAKAASSKTPPPLGVKLHWRPLNTNSVKGTIFENLAKPSTANKVFDSSVAKQLFSKSAVKKQAPTKAPEVKRKVGVEILDAKRAQNVAIILRFPKDSDFDELIECLDTLTLDNPIVNLDNVGKIMSAFPQGQEVESFKLAIQTGADTTTYRDVERKVLKILSRDQMDFKAKVASFALNYKNLLGEIDEQLTTFQRANQQVADNEFLPIVMGVILQYGNFINHGDDSEVQTLGFSLSSASKLIDIKSADNVLSSMHYLVVNMIVKFPDHDFTTFEKSLHHVVEAEKICAIGINEIFDEIREGLNFLIRLEEQVEPDSLLYRKTKELIAESTEAVGEASDRQNQVFEGIKHTWRYLGEECRQGTPLEDIFKILGDFMRCIKKVLGDIQLRPSKFIVAINSDEEREVYTSKFVRSRRR